MDRQTVLDRLNGHEAELRRMGVCSLALFGSTARDEAHEKSDVDLAARLDEGRRIGLFEFAVIRERIEELLGTRVDLLAEPVERPRIRERIERDRVHVF